MNTLKKLSGFDGVKGPVLTIVMDGIGLAPDTEIAEGLAERDKWGYIISDEKCLTATEGMFVAGDCRQKGVRQIATAIADGATASLAAIAYLDNNR
jgi:thioredoxin reductase (NADPH)